MKIEMQTAIRFMKKAFRACALCACAVLFCALTACKKQEKVHVPRERSEKLLEIFSDIDNGRYDSAAKNVHFYATNINPENVFLGTLESKMYTNDLVVQVRQKLDAGDFQGAVAFLEDAKTRQKYQLMDENLYTDLLNITKALATIEKDLATIQTATDSKTMRAAADSMGNLARRSYIRSEKLRKDADIAYNNSIELEKLEKSRRTLWLQDWAENAIEQDDYVRYCVTIDIIKKIAPNDNAVDFVTLRQKADAKAKTIRNNNPTK